MNHEFEAVFQKKVLELGLKVWNQESQSFRMIPVGLTPTTVSKQAWQDLSKDLYQIASAFPKVLKWLQNNEEFKPLFHQLKSQLTGIEQQALDLDPANLNFPVTWRFDLFGEEEHLKVIEVNTTIPAMQAYSDRAKEVFEWQQSFSSQASLVQNSQSHENQDRLLKALMRRYQESGGTKKYPAIGILHRAGDSQIAELQSLEALWSSYGHRITLVTPDHLSRNKNQWTANGVEVDLIYRHIFASKLSGVNFIKTLTEGLSAQIFNPVSAHFELKSFLTQVYEVSSSEKWSKQAGLEKQQVEAVLRRVAECRMISLENIEWANDQLEKNPDHFVLKRSVGYGGHQVILAEPSHSEVLQLKFRQLTAEKKIMSWRDFLKWTIEKDSSPWVIQRRVTGRQKSIEVLTEHGMQTWNAWYDVSAFIDPTAPEELWAGGVSRIGRSPIVNIGTGGGLVPFYTV